MKKKNNLDEMQELKLLKIEHNGCWLAFWGLIAVIVIQMLMGNESPRNISGELCILLILSLYIVIACVKNGIWSRRLKANLKVNAVASIIAGLATGLIFFLISYHNYHSLTGSIAVFIFMMFFTAVICLAALSLVTGIYKRRRRLLDSNDDSDEE